MREYETVFITKPDLPESQLKEIAEKQKALIEKRQGHVFFSRNMGARTLAFPINKQRKGIYFCLDYAAGGMTVSDLERSMRLDENVLRFLTVQKNEEVDVEARAAEIVARGEDVGGVVAEEAAPGTQPEAALGTSGNSSEREE